MLGCQQINVSGTDANSWHSALNAVNGLIVSRDELKESDECTECRFHAARIYHKTKAWFVLSGHDPKQWNKWKKNPPMEKVTEVTQERRDGCSLYGKSSVLCRNLVCSSPSGLSARSGSNKTFVLIDITDPRPEFLLWFGLVSGSGQAANDSHIASAATNGSS